ncbi:oxygen-independent coproporphyrinogen III oxidase [Ilyomonas limi]|uniref:Coproporphyrinogen-III oxidase n=1 Tax=Ilyomonas limi TaxID=2575867 RepID=A0A4U3L860_9BACT|nr:oxygen-independent coproporphyrinogen III oxidase [Ilyomonas limi]TKK71461.1 oxygen-independent coproporphyrinogen III oxidase [Ilyomonas limi]
MNESPAIVDVLVEKYNLPVPRYTSYPTVPYWNEQIDVNDWQQNIQQQFAIHNSTKGISLYIHLPFCESLCTYCGCNKKITTNHTVEEEYLIAIEKEWQLYTALMHGKPVICEIHLGGGTPTFFSPRNLEQLITNILKNTTVHPQHEFSIEGHPNNTTKEHLETLYRLGFRRISYGVQDNNPEVQRVINRIQPIENVELATKLARAIGFTSVNYDLIYGLPLQTVESITTTILQTIQLKPDRIAFYSYAHVPWTSKAQRLFDENDLPSAAIKLLLYKKGKELLMQHGYVDIGMDHFALPHDELYNARMNGTLHRNFMGYTTQHAGMLIGLGVSSISDSGNAYAQNEKTLHNYYRQVSSGQLAIKKGYFLNAEDLRFKRYILDISCTGKTLFNEGDLPLLQQYSFPQLALFAADKLITYNETGIAVLPTGQHFIRNICSAFDVHLQRNAFGKMLFSKSI